MEKGLCLVLLIVAAGIIVWAGVNMWNCSCGRFVSCGCFIFDSYSNGNNSSNFYKNNLTLFNSGPDIYVTAVEPVPAQSPYIVSLSDSLEQQLNKLVLSESSILLLT
ncbi:MAG: hypothetical protein RBT65_10800 [Methanolobus sp.]|nr:hypothetical protein [Methanolobus sp.]